MSDYLSRPIFPIPIDWSQTTAKTFSYDLHELLLGFAAPRHEPLQDFTIAGIQFSVWLNDESEIMDFEDFVDGLKGRLTGFWLPSPFTTCSVNAGVDASSFTIADQNWTDWYSDAASAYLVFTKAGATTQYAKISKIEDNGDGTEIVTLDSGLANAVDPSWSVNRLLYVRLASDDIEFDFVADNRAAVPLRVIELTKEYAAIETGQQPVYLYEFSLATSPAIYWRFTSLNQDVTSSGVAFLTAPIDHGGHSQSLSQGQSSVTLEAWYEEGNPLTRFLPYHPSMPLWLTIYEIDYATPDTRTTIWKGLVETVKLKGRHITAECQAIVAALGRTFPRFFIQPHCNYALFSTSCGILTTNYQATGAIKSISGRSITVEGITEAWAENYAALGWLQVGAGQYLEIRNIETSTAVSGGEMTVQVDYALADAEVGDSITVYAGCDGTAATCKAKFENFSRWGGHVLAPSNLSVKAIEANTSTGNKK
ncbi:MAG: DUF2163 domain-containing protein [Candidatus Omnitrophica bacterium]|nr:DUF2163 domain-containing protein [Candidatus Omnitrophota bacterium]